MVMAYSANNASVGVLQKQLNNCGPTRLPRLVEDNDYGSLTMARVMEFQFLNKFTRHDTDGVVGPITQASINGQPKSSPPPMGRVIVVDLINDRLRAYKSGIKDLDFRPIKGGSATDPSTRGVFKIFRALRKHTSSKFPIPPGNMDFALFYNGAEALHQGPPRIPSHGCIHVDPSEAAKLFNWATSSSIKPKDPNEPAIHDVMVIVLKKTD
jgi:hypothetical protein